MSNSITPFAFGDHMVRVITDANGNPWFVAKDVAKVLGYEWNGSKNIQHVPEEWRGVEFVSTPSGTQEMLTLSEQGLYFFLGRSDKAGALPFQKWLAGEVLPSLRKTGSYTMPHNATVEHAPTHSLPNIPEMAALRPVLRMRAWESALQAARLDSQGMDFALSCFAQICRMLSVNHNPRRMDDDNSQRILQFVDEACRVEPGGRIRANRVYAAFCLWWRRKFHDPEPSIHFFGARLGTLFTKRKQGGNTFYYDLHIENT